jgi:hypothetical protein
MSDQFPSAEESLHRIVNKLDDLETRKSTVIYAQPVHITLQRSAKGGYYWDISIHAPTVSETLDMIHEADERLRKNYTLEVPS